MLPDTSHPTAFRISSIPSIHSSSDQGCLTFTPQDINFSPLIPLHSGSKLCPVPKLILSVRFFSSEHLVTLKFVPSFGPSSRVLGFLFPLEEN